MDQKNKVSTYCKENLSTEHNQSNEKWMSAGLKWPPNRCMTQSFKGNPWCIIFHRLQTHFLWLSILQQLDSTIYEGKKWIQVKDGWRTWQALTQRWWAAVTVSAGGENRTSASSDSSDHFCRPQYQWWSSGSQRLVSVLRMVGFT